MKKLKSITIILAVLLVSCTHQNLKPPYIIIQKQVKKDTPGYMKYTYQTENNFRVEFHDVIDKYNIGDTLTNTSNKRGQKYEYQNSSPRTP
jgi:hypothetical protein